MLFGAFFKSPPPHLCVRYTTRHSVDKAMTSWKETPRHHLGLPCASPKPCHIHALRSSGSRPSRRRDWRRFLAGAGTRLASSSHSPPPRTHTFPTASSHRMRTTTIPSTTLPTAPSPSAKALCTVAAPGPTPYAVPDTTTFDSLEPPFATISPSFHITDTVFALVNAALIAVAAVNSAQAPAARCEEEGEGYHASTSHRPPPRIHTSTSSSIPTVDPSRVRCPRAEIRLPLITPSPIAYPWCTITLPGTRATSSSDDTQSAPKASAPPSDPPHPPGRPSVLLSPYSSSTLVLPFPAVLPLHSMSIDTHALRSPTRRRYRLTDHWHHPHPHLPTHTLPQPRQSRNTANAPRHPRNHEVISADAQRLSQYPPHNRYGAGKDDVQRTRRARPPQLSLLPRQAVSREHRPQAARLRNSPPVSALGFMPTTFVIHMRRPHPSQQQTRTPLSVEAAAPSSAYGEARVLRAASEST
ncbi:hypothetical protein R3P38DRAFT_3581344 [Favolaschia claudopus]|uniref:Uncharacterized protein n=1 Tax=Favolaschia claudopus TaxID=2862362 RepID=A0AAW0AJK0_9AGAR